MALSSAIGSAVAFLVRARGRGGWWHEYDTLAGSSDEWVTGYVGSALASVPEPAAMRTATYAWRLLKTRRWWSAGWGFNRRVPPDADTTAWVLRLHRALGVTGSRRARRARRYLRAHVRPDGGVATYAAEGPIRWFTRLQPKVSLRGWCSSHTCVSAAVALVADADNRRKIVEYLRRSQNPEGNWVGYWWCEDAYATALAAEALELASNSGDLHRIGSAVEWACRRIGPEGAARSQYEPAGSAFGTSCCLRILLLSARRGVARDRLRAAVTWLLRQQRSDGSWQPSAVLRIPPPHVLDPKHYVPWIVGGRAGGSVQVDRGGVFTTATVLSALQCVKASGEEVPPVP